MEWISVKERLPEDIGVVLVFTENELYDIASYIRVFNKWNLSIGMQDDNPTHWTYLINPPN